MSTSCSSSQDAKCFIARDLFIFLNSYPLTTLSILKAFMMELTAHQSNVGNVLQAGNQLIAQGNLTEEEEQEIREQMSLLNSRWENLRVDSMDRQAR